VNLTLGYENPVFTKKGLIKTIQDVIIDKKESFQDIEIFTFYDFLKIKLLDLENSLFYDRKYTAPL